MLQEEKCPHEKVELLGEQKGKKEQTNISSVKSVETS
jgi:hypothetical protein